MKRNPIFIYNNIDEQKLVYANQLTVKDWNRIINCLKEENMVTPLEDNSGMEMN